MRKNLVKLQEQVERLRALIKYSKKIIEKELGKVVLKKYMTGATPEELYQEVKHIIKDVYGYDQFCVLRKKALKNLKKNKNTQEEGSNGREIPKESGIA